MSLWAQYWDQCYLVSSFFLLAILCVSATSSFTYMLTTLNYNISFGPGANTNKCVSQLESCISEIRSWMTENFLCLNDGKSEFLIIGTKQQRDKLSLESINIGQCEVSHTSIVRCLGVIFDEDFLMS